MDVGQKIKSIRESKSITQKQIADAMKKDVSVVSKVENGHGHNQVQTLSEYADALNCTLVVDIREKNDIQRLIGHELDDEFDFTLDLSNKASEIENETQEILANIANDFNPKSCLKKSVYKELVLAKVQNIIIEKILKHSLDEITSESTIDVIATDDSIHLLLDAVTHLSFTRFHYDDLGFEIGWETTTIIDRGLSKKNNVYAIFTDFFINSSNKKEILESIKNSNSEMIRKAEIYLDENDKGFPFFCFLRDRNDSNNNITLYYSDDEINSLCGKVIFGWDQAEAVHKFLTSVDDEVLRNYASQFFLEDLIASYYYDDLDYKLFSDGQRIKNDLDKIFNAIQADDDQKFIELASNVLSVEMAFDILGRENYLKFFVRENKDDVVCFLSDEDQEIYDFVL